MSIQSGKNIKTILAGETAVPLTHIKPAKGWVSLGLRELWQYRGLLYFFVWRDIKVRYKQTVLGAAWAIIQPFVTMVVFSLFFGRLAKMPSDGYPYPIFIIVAQIPWTFFANGVTQASNTLVANANMVKKIYFPRLTMPIAAVLAGLVDFTLAFLVMMGMLFYYDVMPTVKIIWLPLFLLLAFTTSLGVSLWFAAMNVQFRDVRYIVPFFIQVWFFSTPITYSSSLLSEPWRTLYGVNPMVGVTEGFRWALLGTETAPGPVIAISALVSLTILTGGLFYFRRMEKSFADVV